MKQYKVGDTIYIKTTVTEVDLDDPALTYRGFDNEWIDTNTIVDELPTLEPVKPELPKGVADELEDAKNNGLSFIGYMNTAIENDYCETNIFAFVEEAKANKMIKVLSDAWYIGYTVEKEPVYNLILGFDPDESDRRLCNALYKNHGELSIDAATDTYDLRGDDDYQFTQEEIDKYNKNFWIKNIDLNDYKVEVG